MSGKRVITVDNFQYDLLLNGMFDFRNKLLEEEKPIEDVDGLLVKILDTPPKHESKRKSHDAR